MVFRYSKLLFISVIVVIASTSLAFLALVMVSSDTPSFQNDKPRQGENQTNTTTWNYDCINCKGAFTTAYDDIVVKGVISKYYNGPILSGGIWLTNNSTEEYRIKSINYVINYTGLYSDEAAESDVCLTVVPQISNGALSSGEELLCGHEHHKGSGRGDTLDQTLPLGGISLKPGYKMYFASVSQLHPQQVGEDRLNKDFLSVPFTIKLEKADLTDKIVVYSHRSPHRDRSFVADPAREYAPFTDYINNGDRIVSVVGLGVFPSSISHHLPNNLTVEVWVNDNLNEKFFIGSHSPIESDVQSNKLLPLNVELKKGDIISIRGRVDAGEAQVYDFAAFSFADGPLDRINETSITGVDLNGDNYHDYIDYDNIGTVWVETTRVGAHDTQFEWAWHIPRYDKIEVLEDGAVFRLTSEAGLCLNLVRDKPVKFTLHYCDESAVPIIEDRNQVAWGDFNGDGWIDRLRIEPLNNTYNVALGSKDKLQPESVWYSGKGNVDKIFVEHDFVTNKDKVYTEWQSLKEVYLENANGVFDRISTIK